MIRTVFTAEKYQLGAGLSGYIAEIGAAFLGCDLGFEVAPRPDHAAYMDSWISVLQGDKRAIIQAAAYAQKACDLLHGFQEVEHIGTS